MDNPTSYYNGSSYTMQWRNGRELQNLTKGGKKASYEYDVDGLRSLKTNPDGSYSVYYWLGNLLLAEERHTSTSTRILVFSYDENNSPIGFQFKTNDGPWYYYLYAKNIQGNIVALYRRDINADGTRSATHIANYEYDPWGKIISITNAAGADMSDYPDSAANVNPLRYRGYYYDNESGFYYLQSRYYDPSIGRFINADTYASTGQDFLGYNMFAYCNNNPVIHNDPTGDTSITGELFALTAGLFIVALVATINITKDAINSIQQNYTVKYATRNSAASRAMSKAVEKADAKVRNNRKEHDYWATTRVSFGEDAETYIPTCPLSFSTATAYVRNGGNVIASTRHKAYQLARAVGRTKPCGPETHYNKNTGSSLGYRKHYHDGNRKGGHIFYVS